MPEQKKTKDDRAPVSWGFLIVWLLANIVGWSLGFIPGFQVGSVIAGIPIGVAQWLGSVGR